MARISGVNIPKEKRAEVALTYIYGIGIATARKILKELKFDVNTKIKDFSDEQINQLRQKVESIKVEGELRRERISNVKRLKEIKSYRGTRHSKGLPARGQRTKTNSRTVRGNKRITMGSGRAPSAQKT
ncbi:MAG: 30S ribosomal protein S13 [Candidatus Komeilibacteria bacterium RIFOXYC1_FULL_37_11]|uniref:Small ribosomal subunit protein uS13 n=1 Tax=Candidatus Komeilibacteria bacterium RIFOXYC1_FULL_37_11 TaxID=1798555 RepID=A0A1G2BZS5_9BACT|nr:MAG: 30S ribosomal protein S13 [Candidatus Komeilibacteria bacterium RIFOXYC1_FULL_37_11]OGY95481.1 MAG: 30S ribosomal protein S13 [Candidatus Komeilibacteria bacterium RIFOXYD1_FULL_37_29]OGY96259.1 MAG: 30S ribosomal protein S13 [Candidatus Komeilibacteria bacterium RIFOXYD2_FULL_37_8]